MLRGGLGIIHPLPLRTILRSYQSARVSHAYGTPHGHSAQKKPMDLTRIELQAASERSMGYFQDSVMTKTYYRIGKPSASGFRGCCIVHSSGKTCQENTYSWTPNLTAPVSGLTSTGDHVELVRALLTGI